MLVNINMAEADRAKVHAEEKKRMALGAAADLEDPLGLVRLPTYLPHSYTVRQHT